MVKAQPFEAAAATAVVGCVDTTGWQNPYDATCAKMVTDGHCKDGALVPGHEWAAGEAYGSPEANCCSCGKDAAKDDGGDGDVAACEDTPAWRNAFAATCATYASEGHCLGGAFARGHEWTQGVDFGEPEAHCCACGKGRAVAPTAPAAAAQEEHPAAESGPSSAAAAPASCSWIYLPGTALHWEIGQFALLQTSEPVEGGWLCAKLCLATDGCDAYSFRRGEPSHPQHHRCFLLHALAGGNGAPAAEFDSAALPSGAQIMS